MNESPQTFPNGTYPKPAQPQQDLEAIHQAQRAWRETKRREIEEKARKKAFKAANSPINPHPIYQPQPTPRRPILDPGAAANLAHAAATAAAHQPHPLPSLDVPAAVIHTHLNSGPKRAHLNLEPGSGPTQPDETCDAVAAAAAAVAHAAATATPGDAQFAPAVLSTSVGATDGASATRSEIQGGVDTAQRALLEQIEAKRRWRVEKRREIALKRAKGAGSKRGRKKMRIQPAVMAEMQMSAGFGQQEEVGDGIYGQQQVEVVLTDRGVGEGGVDVMTDPHNIATEALRASVEAAAAAIPDVRGRGGAEGKEGGKREGGNVEAGRDEGVANEVKGEVQPAEGGVEITVELEEGGGDGAGGGGADVAPEGTGKKEGEDIAEREETTAVQTEAKTGEENDGFGVDGGVGEGEDIMTAAAWQSLDSISHT